MGISKGNLRCTTSRINLWVCRALVEAKSIPCGNQATYLEWIARSLLEDQKPLQIPSYHHHHTDSYCTPQQWPRTDHQVQPHDSLISHFPCLEWCTRCLSQNHRPQLSPENVFYPVHQQHTPGCQSLLLQTNFWESSYCSLLSTDLLVHCIL